MWYVLVFFSLCVAMTDVAQDRLADDHAAAQSRASAHLADAAVRALAMDKASRHDSAHSSPSPSSSSSTIERTLRIRGLPFGATTD